MVIHRSTAKTQQTNRLHRLLRCLITEIRTGKMPPQTKFHPRRCQILRSLREQPQCALNIPFATNRRPLILLFTFISVRLRLQRWRKRCHPERSEGSRLSLLLQANPLCKQSLKFILAILVITLVCIHLWHSIPYSLSRLRFLIPWIYYSH